MNHLIVGLGGTGGKVLAAVRRLIYQQYRTVEPSDLALDYLYIDTSEQDTSTANITAPLQAGDRVWRTLGHSVQLAPSQIVHLKQGNFTQILENLDDYKTIKRWIGDAGIWRGIWNSAPNGIEAGGQLRRFGRLLFAQNARQVKSALTSRFSAPQAAGGVADSRWSVHVITGLAGGTGSGTFIDTLGMIRKLTAGTEAKIVLYAVLPETEDTTWAKENYYANGYAALAELNGFLVKRFTPADVNDAAGVYRSDTPVNNTFIITNRNENGLLVDVDKVLPEIVAETLFQIVVASGDARALNAGGPAGGNTDDRKWRQMVTGENYFGGYEKDVPNGPDERANRFLSFGIKRIAIPHQEVREYASMVFLRQFLLQSLNNYWVDGQGFTENRRIIDGTAVARSPDNRQKWCLTDQHLMLETATLDNDKREWRSIADDFRSALNGKTTSLIDSVKDKDGWPRELEEFAREYFERGYRLAGVAEFYRVAERSIADRARSIVRARIAGNLFESWIGGLWSVRDVAHIVDELIVDVTERMHNADARINDLTPVEAQKEALRKKQLSDYASRGMLSNIVHNRKQSLQQFSATLADLYAIRAKKIAYAYLQKTLSSVLSQLQDLKADVETVAGRLDEAFVIVEARRAQRVKVEGEAVAQSHLHKLYDPRHVRDLLKRFEQTESLQRSQTSGLRAKLVEQLGAQPSFTAFAENMSEGSLVEALEAAAEERAEEALAAAESERDRILETSVVQKLYEEYSGRDEELRRFIAERVREAGTFAAFAPNQGIAHGVSDIERALVAFVPAAEELRETLRPFHANLVRIIKGAGNGIAVEVVETRDRKHEIVFLSLVNQFPLRHLRALEYLSGKYERLTTGPDKARKRLELHIEDSGATLPSLFAMSIGETREQLKPVWLIGQCAGLLQERVNSRTGLVETIIITTDEDGAENVACIGEKITSGPKTIDPGGALALQSVVRQYLAELIHVDQKAELIKKLVACQNAALKEAGYDPTHPEVEDLKQVVLQAREMVKA